jgi:hypothetical protein
VPSGQAVDDDISRVLELMRLRRLWMASAIMVEGNFIQMVADNRISTCPSHANRITRVAFKLSGGQAVL